MQTDFQTTTPEVTPAVPAVITVTEAWFLAAERIIDSSVCKENSRRMACSR